jgi:formamidopyrimidine-DNA glycosylase
VPELPEVETVTRDLRPLLTGRTIVAARRLSEVELRRPWQAEWAGRLTGLSVLGTRRRGKWIVVPLSDGSALLFHLGMTGQLTVVDSGEPLGTHVHLAFDLDDGKQLRFRDTRRFGSSTLFDNEQQLNAFFDEIGLGPEPFDLDPQAWRAALGSTERNLKAVLLDQNVVAGVGNIYADEALFRARLHPARRACDLTGAEADRLRESIVEVLNEAIDRRGSTIRDYVGGSGLMGGFQDEFRAYGRTGEPCPRCGTPIVSARLAGRSSHFCPHCQPASGQRSAVSGQPKARARKGGRSS